MTTGNLPNKPASPENPPSVPTEGEQGERFGGFSDKPGQAPAGPEQKDV